VTSQRRTLPASSKSPPDSTEVVEVHDLLIDPIRLFSDGLALLYHEARHVRFLIEKGYVEPLGWERVVSLPRNRVEAWKQVRSTRETAQQRPTARDAAGVFQKRFGKSLEEITQLNCDPNWRHARAYGGHAWRTVSAFVAALGKALDLNDVPGINEHTLSLLQAKHNTGLIRDKIVELDREIGFPTGPWCRETAR